MEERLTREQFLEMIYQQKYDELKDKELRLVSVHVPGREIVLAQVIGASQRRVYENLGLHIGTHFGEDHTGESIGIMHIVPNEATVVAADMATKYGNVEVGFLDRFSGCVIVLGSRSDVYCALEGVLDFFKYKLKFTVCEITEV